MWRRVSAGGRANGAALLFALTLVACHRRPGTGLDAGPPPLDAPEDVRIDGRGPMTRDAPLDAGSDAWDPARWVRFGTLPDECPVEVALAPDRALLPLWRACGRGCLEWSGDELTWSQDGASPRTAVVSWWEGELRYVVWVDVDEGARLALRAPRLDGASCSVHMIPDGDAAAVVVQFEVHEPPRRSWTRVHRVVPSPPTGLRLLHEREGFFALEEVTASESVIALVSSYQVITVGEGAVWLRAADSPRNARLLGDELCFLARGPRTSLACARAGEDPRLVRTLDSPADLQGDVTSFSRDDRTLVWLEGRDDPLLGRHFYLQLWAGTLEGGTIRDPHLVSALPGDDPGAAGDGLFVHSEREGTDETPVFAFYRLADGARATFAPPAGASTFGVVYVSATEVLLGMQGRVVRVDPRALRFE